MTTLVEAIPLTMDSHGVYRVGGSRVTLDLLVRAFNRGATAELDRSGIPDSAVARRLPGDRLLLEAQRRTSSVFREA